MKCRIMWHFILVFTLCQITHLGVSGTQRVRTNIFLYLNHISNRKLPFSWSPIISQRLAMSWWKFEEYHAITCKSWWKYKTIKLPFAKPWLKHWNYQARKDLQGASGSIKPIIQVQCKVLVEIFKLLQHSVGSIKNIRKAFGMSWWKYKSIKQSHAMYWCKYLN